MRKSTALSAAGEQHWPCTATPAEGLKGDVLAGAEFAEQVRYGSVWQARCDLVEQGRRDLAAFRARPSFIAEGRPADLRAAAAISVALRAVVGRVGRRAASPHG
jgi:hypothetical protein